jgi:hypothetical protein
VILASSKFLSTFNISETQSFFHVLPEKLIIHDPRKLLSVSDVHGEGDDWRSSRSSDSDKTVVGAKGDIMWVYELSLSQNGVKKHE